MAQYKDKKNVGASTADDILNIAKLQGDENNGYCVRLTDEKTDEVIEKLAEHGICGQNYFNKEKSRDRSYGDLYVSRIKDNGYVWVLILYARRGSAEVKVEKYRDYLVEKGDSVAKSDIIALSASYEKSLIVHDEDKNVSPLSCTGGGMAPCIYLSENCVISSDIKSQDACSYFGNELAAVYEPCEVEFPTDSSVGYQRLHPDFKYAYLKEEDYSKATDKWSRGTKINLKDNSITPEMKILIEKISSANSQLLSTVYKHAKQR